MNPEKMVKELAEEEKWHNVLTSLCICLFTREIYDPGTVVSALKSVGINIDPEALIELGEEIYLLKHRLRIKLRI